MRQLMMNQNNRYFLGSLLETKSIFGIFWVTSCFTMVDINSTIVTYSALGTLVIILRFFILFPIPLHLAYSIRNGVLYQKCHWLGSPLYLLSKLSLTKLTEKQRNCAVVNSIWWANAANSFVNILKTSLKDKNDTLKFLCL